MSDVGDVNRAHMKQPDDPLDIYVEAARGMLDPTASISQRLLFMPHHTARNVAALGDRIEALRAENRALLEAMYGQEGLDKGEETE